MSEQPLADLRVIEGSAFVAAPLGGMTLAQLGADVIRFDQIGGGLDHKRWPLAPSGQSLFWAGLNKGKRSLRINLRSDEGRELVSEVIAAAGAFLTNFPARGWLSYETLRARRASLLVERHQRVDVGGGHGAGRALQTIQRGQQRLGLRVVARVLAELRADEHFPHVVRRRDVGDGAEVIVVRVADQHRVSHGSADCAGVVGRCSALA